MKYLMVNLLLILFISSTVFSQTSDKWKRIDAEDLSISIPPNFTVNIEKRPTSSTTVIVASQNGVVLEFNSSKSSDPKARLKYLRFNEEYNNTSYKYGNFDIVRMSSKTKIDEKFFIASKKNFHYVQITSSNVDAKESLRILTSIKLDGQLMFGTKDSNNTADLEEEIVKLNTLKPSPEVLEALSRKYEKRNIEVINESLKNFRDDVDYDGLSRPPLVVDKPNPNFTPNLNSLSSELFIKLKVSLLADGSVGKIITYSNSPSDFVSACVEAAKRVKFVAAQKDNKNVDSLYILEYRIMAMPIAMPGVRSF